MTRWTLPLILVAACTDPLTDDKATDDTDTATDTGDTSDSGDTGSGDSGSIGKGDSGSGDSGSGDSGSTGDSGDSGDSGSGDSGSPTTACTLSTLTQGTQATVEPSTGHDIRLVNTVEACVSASGLDGLWRTLVTNTTTGQQVCAFEVDMSSTTVTSACTTCDRTFTGVSYTGATISNTTLCGVFFRDASFVTNLNANYDVLGTTAAGDIVYESGSAAWLRVDDNGTASPRTEHTDGSHVEVIGVAEYPY
ncbi:MAG: hypothetical protein H6732_00645 [Alphaproteobacteria bacterium]|nr:hypothetical protein [Alphaproteobacteria bacterium]